MPSKKSPIEYSDDIMKDEATPPLAKHRKTSSIYAYDKSSGHYSLIPDEDIGQFVYNHFLKAGIPNFWNPASENSVVQALKRHPQVRRVTRFNDHNSLINLKNGIIDLDEDKQPNDPFTIIPHNPDYYFTSTVNIPYLPEEKSAPTFLNTLHGIFQHTPTSRQQVDTNSIPTDKSAVEAIIRLGGYIMYPKNKINKIFIFYGNGSNGKSIIMEHVFKKFFTQDSMSALSLNVMSNEESFSREKLITSRINFATEQKASTIESEELKKIASGETITIDIKNKQCVDINPNCKIIVSANRLPRFKDTTYGTDRRLYIFNFKNQFLSQQEYDKKEGSPYRGMYVAKNEEKLKKDLESELPSILNIFLTALQDLRENNWYFPDTENSDEIKDEYKEESDPIGTWLLGTFKRVPQKDISQDNVMTAKDVMDMYEIHQNLTEMSTKKLSISTRYFAKRIRELFRVDNKTIYYVDEASKRTSKKVFDIEVIQSEDKLTDEQILDHLNFNEPTKPTQASF